MPLFTVSLGYQNFLAIWLYVRNADIWGHCFGNHFSDIVSDIRNAFRICYDASPVAVHNRQQELFPNSCQVGTQHWVACTIEWPSADLLLCCKLRSDKYGQEGSASLRDVGIGTWLLLPLEYLQQKWFGNAVAAIMIIRAQTCIQNQGNNMEGRTAQ